MLNAVLVRNDLTEIHTYEFRSLSLSLARAALSLPAPRLIRANESVGERGRLFLNAHQFLLISKSICASATPDDTQHSTQTLSISVSTLYFSYYFTFSAPKWHDRYFAALKRLIFLSFSAMHSCGANEDISATEAIRSSFVFASSETTMAFERVLLGVSSLKHLREVH